MSPEVFSPLPNRMFAARHEPVGIRVTAYHPTNGIRVILNALEEDEVEYLRNTSFGKFLTIVEKPSFLWEIR
ncbi:unnamed protein product [Arabis nemorensis]|uniref:Uncharacterized protein n=1 Tax=Arabis nemorensis TaxID=586526 RepID=A0A565CEF6_9BRAS|nr:unnamed protein product [Arabis nemorensis]